MRRNNKGGCFHNTQLLNFVRSLGRIGRRRRGLVDELRGGRSLGRGMCISERESIKCGGIGPRVAVERGSNQKWMCRGWKSFMIRRCRPHRTLLVVRGA